MSAIDTDALAHALRLLGIDVAAPATQVTATCGRPTASGTPCKRTGRDGGPCGLHVDTAPARELPAVVAARGERNEALASTAPAKVRADALAHAREVLGKGVAPKDARRSTRRVVRAALGVPAGEGGTERANLARAVAARAVTLARG